MKSLTILGYASLCLACYLPISAQAQSNPGASAQDGVKVDKMSGFRNLVPAQQVEEQASLQYRGLKQQANQQGALAGPNDPQLQRLQAIAQKIIPFALRWNPRAPQWQWEVTLLKSNQVNAFCMPGGKIAFYSAILDRLKLTDDEVAIVMGHEIAHALREHGRERMGKAGATNVAAKLAALGVAKYFKLDPNVTDAVAGKGAQLLVLKFSREDETEADTVGLDIAARAGYDPRAGVTLWQKMGIINKGAPPQWLSTHPAGTTRIAEIRQHLPEVMPLYAKAQGRDVSALGPYRSNVKGVDVVQ